MVLAKQQWGMGGSGPEKALVARGFLQNYGDTNREILHIWMPLDAPTNLGNHVSAASGMLQEPVDHRKPAAHAVMADISLGSLASFICPLLAECRL
ncbi:hypothetical protein JZ751_002545 [Albula glossodonta]|uniref:Uncharacterized protein n=1 Tax=Albula glossodonta TaxID=121402 RepID=A0A8T2NET6_9TELE|nr:hypothetical protein JZ751_002545 [Albula glossodonta]